MTAIKIAVPLHAGGFAQIWIDDKYVSRAENLERDRLELPRRTFMPREWIERMKEPWTVKGHMRNLLELCAERGIPPTTEEEIQKLWENRYVPETQAEQDTASAADLASIKALT